MIARRGLRIADAAELAGAARRAGRLRVLLVGALVALVAAAVAFATRSSAPPEAAAVPEGRVTEIVLDVSGSVGDQTFRYTARTLRRLSEGGPVGLVVFSDSAEEALPPGTPAAELTPLLRLYRPVRRVPAYSSSRILPPVSPYPVSPWYTSFSGGTRISAGLAAARQALARDRLHGRVVVISDLGDAADDLRKMKLELVKLEQAGIQVRVMPLPNTLPRDLKRFRTLEGPDVAKVDVAPRPREPQAAGLGVPAALAALAVLVALTLAANELYGVSMRWCGPT